MSIAASSSAPQLLGQRSSPLQTRHFAKGVSSSSVAATPASSSTKRPVSPTRPGSRGLQPVSPHPAASLARPPTGLLSQAAKELISTPKDFSSRPSFVRGNSVRDRGFGGRQRRSQAVNVLDRRLSSAFKEMEHAQEAEALGEVCSSSTASPRGGLALSFSTFGSSSGRGADEGMSSSAAASHSSSFVETPLSKTAMSSTGFCAASSSSTTATVPTAFHAPWRRHPSRSARRENFKKEHYAARIEMGDTARSTSAAAAGEDASALEGLGPTSEAVDIMPMQVFLEDLGGVSARIEELARKMREDTGSAADARRRAEEKAREEERRRMEVEQRRLRKKEQEARDPKKKVALRLENKRRFGQDGEQEPVPMKTVEYVGAKGREEVNVVDVKGLQQRCILLDSGSSSVEDLVDYAKHHTGSTRKGAASAATTSTSWAKETFRDTNYDERSVQVAAQREAQFVEKAIRQIATMRGGARSGAGFYHIVQQVKSPMAEENRVMQTMKLSTDSLDETPRTSPLSDRNAAPSPMSELRKSITMTSSPKVTSSTVDELVRHYTNQGGVNGLLTQVQTNNLKGKKDMVKANEDALRARRKLKNVDLKRPPLNVAQRKRARLRLAAIVASARLIMLHRLVAAKQKSLPTVLEFMSQIGEWARMKLVIRRTAAGVRKIQRFAREYLELRKKRLAIMEKDFQRVEDRELESYFRKLSQKLIHDEQNKAAKDVMGKTGGMTRQLAMSGKQTSSFMASMVDAKTAKKIEKMQLYSEIQAQMKEDDSSFVDWRAWRIPPSSRIELLGFYYTEQIRKKVRSKQQFHNFLAELLQSHRDMAVFLRSLSGDDVATKNSLGPFLEQTDVVTGVPKLPFWQLTEVATFALIGFGAEALINVNPLHDHPANKDLLDNPIRRVVKEEQQRSAAVNGGMRDVVHRVDRFLARRAAAGIGAALSGANTSRDASKEFSRNRRPAPTTTRREAGAAGNGGAAGAVQGLAADASLIPPDLEDIFDLFTPRLKQITEEQTQEHRAVGAPRGTTPPAARVTTPPLGEGALA